MEREINQGATITSGITDVEPQKMGDIESGFNDLHKARNETFIDLLFQFLRDKIPAKTISIDITY